MTPQEQTNWIWTHLESVAYLHYPNKPELQRAWITGFMLSHIREGLQADSLNQTRLLRALDAAEQRARQLNQRMQ